MKTRNLAVLFIVLLFTSGVAHCQTISPVVSEYGKKAAGSFLVQNNTLSPMAVVVESYSWSADSTGQHFRKLDPSVHVELSETSARLSPKEIHQFDYKVKCDQLPCTFSFLAGMIVGHTADGMQVRLILPHTVYVCDKQKDCRRHVLDSFGLFATK